MVSLLPNNYSLSNCFYFNMEIIKATTDFLNRLNRF